MNDDTTNSPSRRLLLHGGLATLAAMTAPFAAFADEKLAQSVVQYQETPNDGNKCSDCVNFVAPNSCKIVAGTINPNGWCVAFAPKA